MGRASGRKWSLRAQPRARCSVVRWAGLVACAWPGPLQPPSSSASPSIYHQVPPNSSSSSPNRSKERIGECPDISVSRGGQSPRRGVHREWRQVCEAWTVPLSTSLLLWTREPSKRAWHAAALHRCQLWVRPREGPGGKGKARLRGHLKVSVFQTLPHLSHLARYPPSGHPGRVGGSPAPSLATAPARRLCLHLSRVPCRGRWGRGACIPSEVALCSIPVPGIAPSTYQVLSKGWLLSVPRVPDIPRATQDARHPSGRLVLPWYDKAQGGQTCSGSPVSM